MKNWRRDNAINQGVKLIAYPVFALHHACVSKKGGGSLKLQALTMDGLQYQEFQFNRYLSKHFAYITTHPLYSPLKHQSYEMKYLHPLCSRTTVASCNISLAFLSGVHPARSISLYTSDTYSSQEQNYFNVFRLIRYIQ